MSEPTPFGRYVLLDQLAIGGMAELYLAKIVGAAGFERICAIKRVLPEFAADGNFINRFLDEARLAAKLTHPGIVQVFDLGKEGDSYFIAMEYLAGENLQAVIKQVRSHGTTIPIEVAARLISSASEALHHAHNAKDSDGTPLRLVHRDVSPTNLILTYDGILKVVDFGIAKAAAQREATRHGVVLGKAAYMSPERVNLKPVDHRDDIWGLGVCLHELLTVQRAFARANTRQSMQAVLVDDAPPPSSVRPDVPPELDAIVLRALQKDPAQRYQSAHELRDDLEAFLSSRGGGPQPKDLAQFLVGLFGEAREREMRLRTSGDHPAYKARAGETAMQVGSADLVSSSTGSSFPTDAGQLQEPPRFKAWMFVAAAVAGMAVVGGAHLLLRSDGPEPLKPGPEATDFVATVKEVHVVDASAEVERVVAAEQADASVVVANEVGTPDASLVVETPVVTDEPEAADAGEEEVVAAPQEEEQKQPVETVAASAALGILNLTANVRAAASIDGRPFAPLPLKGHKLRPGVHQLRIVDKEHGGQRTMRVDIDSGKALDRHVSFGKGKLAVHSDPWAEVTVDGKSVGQTPLGGIELWEGPHTVNLKTSLGERTKKVQIRADKSEVIREKWR